MPGNVLRFEALLYISILIDMYSSVFLERDQDMTDAATESVNIVLIVIFVALIALVIAAARQRRNWARWTLLVWQVLSILATLYVHSLGDITVELLVNLASTAIASAGLYFSFTGDARDWFDA